MNKLKLLILLSVPLVIAACNNESNKININTIDITHLEKYSPNQLNTMEVLNYLYSKQSKEEVKTFNQTVNLISRKIEVTNTKITFTYEVTNKTATPIKSLNWVAYVVYNDQVLFNRNINVTFSDDKYLTNKQSNKITISFKNPKSKNLEVMIEKLSELHLLNVENKIIFKDNSTIEVFK